MAGTYLFTHAQAVAATTLPLARRLRCDGRLSGSFCGRSTSERREDRQRSRAGRCPPGPDFRERVPMTLRWRYLLGSRLHDPQAEALLDDRGGPRREQHPPPRGGDLLRIESVREQGVPAFVAAGTLFAERLLDGVVLSVWILGAMLIGEGGPVPNGHRARPTALGVFLVSLARGTASGRRLHWRDDQMAAPAVAHARPAAAHSSRGAFRGRWRVFLVFTTSAGMWLADVAMYYIVGQAFDLDIGVGGYFLLEGVGNPRSRCRRPPPESGPRLPDAHRGERHRHRHAQGHRVRPHDARPHRPSHHASAASSCCRRFRARSGAGAPNTLPPKSRLELPRSRVRGRGRPASGALTSAWKGLSEALP